MSARAANVPLPGHFFQVACLSKNNSDNCCKKKVGLQSVVNGEKENRVVVVIMMYIYHALINALSADIIHINLNTIFYAAQLYYLPWWEYPVNGSPNGDEKWYHWIWAYVCIVLKIMMYECYTLLNNRYQKPRYVLAQRAFVLVHKAHQDFVPCCI